MDSSGRLGFGSGNFPLPDVFVVIEDDDFVVNCGDTFAFKALFEETLDPSWQTYGHDGQGIATRHIVDKDYGWNTMDTTYRFDEKWLSGAQICSADGQAAPLRFLKEPARWRHLSSSSTPLICMLAPLIAGGVRFRLTSTGLLRNRNYRLSRMSLSVVDVLDPRSWALWGGDRRKWDKVPSMQGTLVTKPTQRLMVNDERDREENRQRVKVGG